MTLKTDLWNLKSRKKSRAYQTGVLTASNGQQWRISVRAAGRFRLNKSETPPLKIKFRQEDLVEEGLDTFDHFKIILPFYPDALGEELLVREYLVYRMFERLDGNGIRTKLTHLQIRDTYSGTRMKTLALLIEDDKETAARMGATATERPGIPMDSLEQYQAALNSLFQYMIGNADWDFRMVRNVLLLEPLGGGPILSMPYDFDFAGLVNAPYAQDALRGRLRDRVLQDQGIDTRTMETVADVFMEARADLLAICQSPLLSQTASDDMVAYLESFFCELESGKGALAVYKK